ncbi:MAG TPA: PQQ-binding-like beta-propeller repeat protein [Steroidobacteraceae bacterium]|nr:PQQ-binding-like beta-propeller repeat protein [Steroidobacteraceae bacterium]
MRTIYKAVLTCAVATACGCAALSQQADAPGSREAGSSSSALGAAKDWPTFGGSNARTNANMAATKITAANVGTMVRQQVTISAPIDAGLIYLGAVKVHGAAHDVFFGTTNVGRTVAIDANDGTVLWEYASPGFNELAAATGVPTGSRGLIVKQITNSTPVADANRQYIYAAAADGKVTKLSIADGKAVWSTAVTRAPILEKLDSPLSFVQGTVLVPTAGYVGDTPPYQGHIAVLDAKTGAIRKVWNSLCSDRPELLDPASCAQTQSAIWGRAGIVIVPGTGNLLFATGNGPWDGKTAWGDSVIMLDPSATKILGNWTTPNNEELNKKDLDVGSTSPVLLGDGYIAQGGKDGTIRLLSMNVIKGSAPHQGGDLQVVEVPGKAQLLAASATAKIGGTTYLFASNGRGGTTAWTFGADHQLKEAWKSKTGGNSPFYAGGLLYVYDPAPRGAKLHVFDAVSGNSVADLEAGGGHWNSPIVVDNRIAMPEGAISGFGFAGGRRPGPPGAPAAAAPPPPPPGIPHGIVDIWRLP